MRFKKILSLFLTLFLLLTVISVSPVLSFADYEDDILFEEDFDDYEEGSITKDNLKAESAYEDNILLGSATNHGYKINKTAGGTKYLTISNEPEKGKSGGYKFAFDERFTHGNLVAEIKILPDEYSTADVMNYFIIKGYEQGTDTKYDYYTLSTNTGTNLYGAKNANCIVAQNKTPDNMPVPDSEGFWNLRMVLSRKSTSDNWAISIYDATNNNVIISNPDISALSKIDVYRIDFVDMYGDSDNPANFDANIADLRLYIPADVTAYQKSAYDADEKKVIFNASEKLLPETVNKDNIKVFAPSGEEVIGDVSLDDDGTDIVVSFPYGLPKDGSYKLVAEGVHTERNVPVSFEESFEGTKTVIPFVLAEISPEEGVIPALQKSITLTFTKEPDDAMLSEITFKTSDGGDIPGSYKAEISGKDVIVSFGKLNPGDYILTVDAGFADKDEGIQLGETCEFSYKVEEEKSNGEDYQSSVFVTGTEYTAQEIKSLSENVIYGASGNYTIAEEGGDKYVSMNAPSANAGASVALQLPDAVTDGIAEMDVKVKGIGGSLARHVFRVYGSSGDVYLLSMNNGTDITPSTNSNNAGGEFCDDAPEVGADGFFNLKLRMSAGNPSDDWLVEIFDTLDSERLFYSVTVPRSKLSNITRIFPGAIWTVDYSETSRTLCVSEMYFHRSEFVSVIEAPTTVLPTDETLAFKLDDDVSAEKLNIKLVSKDNTEISCECAYSSTERMLYVKPQSFLTWGMTYTLKITGAGIKPYTFAVSDEDCAVNQKKVSYLTESGTVFDMPVSGDFDASVYVSVNAPKGREIMIVFAAYDAKGYPVKISHKNVVSSEENSGDTVIIEGLSAEKCKTVQCFVWEKTPFGYKVVK